MASEVLVIQKILAQRQWSAQNVLYSKKLWETLAAGLCEIICTLSQCHTNEDTKIFSTLKEDISSTPKIGHLIVFPEFATLQYYVIPIIIVTHINVQSSWAFEC